MIRFHFSHYILVILFALLNATAIFYPQSIKFNNLTVENGLSNNDVNTLIQDKTGFIWFGTEDGLNRYDGYNFKVFRHNPTDSNSLSNNSIWALLEDRKGNIWIGTKDGNVNKFNPRIEKFSHIVPKPKLKEWNSITTLYEDKSGNKWIGTHGGGLAVYKQGGVVSIEDESDLYSQYPNNFLLLQNFPNPFNPVTIISWQLPVGSHETIKIFDVLGNEVATLVDEYREAGSYEVEFDASNISTGIYFYKLQSGSFVQTRKMILLK